MKYSAFNVHVIMNRMALLKNMLTNAVVRIPEKLLLELISDRMSVESVLTRFGYDPQPFQENGFVVENDLNEFSSWLNDLIETRNNKAHRMTLHFLPTTKCQFRCNYCFEKGSDRTLSMSDEVLNDTVSWIGMYLHANREIDELRMILFGGEPFLKPNTCVQAVKNIRSLCNEHKVAFWVEAVTNGELIDEKIISDISSFSCRRIQVTLDGPEMIHNTRRHGVNGRKTYLGVLKAVQLLLTSNVVRPLDIRLSFDHSNCDAVIEYLDELSHIHSNIDDVNLSLGFITSTFENTYTSDSKILAEKAVTFWEKAKKLGFAIPETHYAGPLCSAAAKHSAVLLPDGNIQKCFVTAGRSEFNVSTIDSPVYEHLKDIRFEHWERMRQCISEQCAYLPVCGGGCRNDAIIASKNINGASKRFCQKEFLDILNKGLLSLTYS